MVKGIRAYDPKQRRAIRRRNHFARDLEDRRYHQRRIEHKDEDYDWKEEVDEYYSDPDVYESGESSG